MGLVRTFPGEPAVVLGTGPSLAGQIAELTEARRRDRCRLFGINCTYRTFGQLDVHTACNIEWWDTYGEEFRGYRGGRPVDAYHWDAACATRYGIQWMPGRWGLGLSTDPDYIHLGHSSGVQALNLALHARCDPIILVGFELTEQPGQPRHYFRDLSDVPGEYPPHLRHYPKLSNGHEGLLPIYTEIAGQARTLTGFPRIINATPGGKLEAFPRMALADALEAQR